MELEEPENCPNCGSTKIKKVEEEISEYTWKVRVNRWKCAECGAHWDLTDPTYFEEWKKEKKKRSE